MLARVAYALAALLFAVSLAAIALETQRVPHYALEAPGGVPTLIYEPPGAASGERLPVIVAAHPLLGSASALDVQAHHLARAGYALILPERAGHGRSTRSRRQAVQGVEELLAEDLAAAVQLARMHPRFDAERLALLGHGEGARAVLAYAARDPSVAAVVAISGGEEARGPYPVPNLLLLWGAFDPDASIARWRSLGAKLAGLERLVVGRSYGDPSAGTGVRLVEIEGRGPIGLLYSASTAREVLDWLALTLGPGLSPDHTPGVDARLAWSALAALAALVLIFGWARLLAPFAPPAALPEVAHGGRRLLALVLAVALAVLFLAATDSAATGGPFGFVPLEPGRPLLGVLALSGAQILVGLGLSGRRPGRGLREVRSWVVAALYFVPLYLFLGAALQPLVSLWPAPHRLPWCAGAAALVFPYFAASEWLLRGPGRVVLALLGKLLTLGVLCLAAWLELLPRGILLGAGAILVALLALELLAARLARVAPAPWIVALFESAALGWALGTLLPLG